MTYPRGLLLLLLPTYLSCSVFLATYTPGAAALSFNLNFSTPSDRQQLILINNSYAANDRIVLTDDKPDLTGQVVHSQAVRLWDDRTGRRASFDTSFFFEIKRGNADNKWGDGMAFFIGPRSPSGGGGGYLGLFNDPDNPALPNPRTIAVEFDTCRNDGWDPEGVTDHIGIDINSIRSNQTADLQNKRLFGNMWASIAYNGEHKTMKVTLRTPDSDEKLELGRTLDLKDAELPQDAAIGFSAATGPLHESHHLLSWSFSSTDPSAPPKTKLWVILVSIAASVILAGSVATLLICISTSTYGVTARASSTECSDLKVSETKHTTGDGEIVLPVARKFSYSELVAATDDFPEEREIGAGSFGKVYRGTFRDLQEVAVKKLTGTTEASWKNYETEIKTLCQLSHRNLVKLIGWCNEGDKLLLVYELMPNGSLNKHLHGHGKTLSWLQRYNILLGIASAIDYLHIRHDTKRCVLHRDIKPGNVLLDEDFEAKLGDFGLVRQLCRQPAAGTTGTGTGTTVIGSKGYIDPTYKETGKLSPASDVYSFGVLMLEVATGRKPVVPRETEGHRNTLVDAVRRYYDRDAILEMADERLKGEFEQWQMERVMLTGLLCVQMDQQKRPSIKDAIDLLSNREQYPPLQIPE